MVKLFSILNIKYGTGLIISVFLSLMSGIFSILMVYSIVPFLSILTNQRHEINAYYLDVISFVSEFFGIQEMLASGVVCLSLIVVSNALNVSRTIVIANFTIFKIRDLSSALAGAIFSSKLDVVEQFDPVSIKNLVTNETHQFVLHYLWPLAEMVTSLITIMAIVILVGVLYPFEALTLFSLIGISYLAVLWSARGLVTKASVERFKSNESKLQYFQYLQDNYSYLHVSGAAKDAVKIFDGKMQVLAASQRNIQVVTDIPQYFLHAFAFGGMVLFTIFYIVSNDVSIEKVIPMFGLFAFAGQRALPEAQKAYRSFTLLRVGQEILLKMSSFVSKLGQVDEKISIPLGDITSVSISRGETEIEYDGLKIEKGLNFIIGSSGSGKSTLGQFFAGLRPGRIGSAEFVSTSAVYLENANTAYMPQTNWVISGSIADNLRFGNSDELPDESLVGVLKQVELQYDLDYIVQESGLNLSGGQINRLCLARTLLAGSETIILDEPFSAIDQNMEKRILQRLDAMKDKIVIIITHSISFKDRPLICLKSL